MKLILLTLAATVLQCVLGANILAILPMPSKSHGILMERLLRTLDERGHKITYVTSTAPSKKLGNVQVINVPNLQEILMKNIPGGGDKKSFLQLRGMSPWLHPIGMTPRSASLCNAFLQYQPVQELIHSNQTFDLILGEIFLDESILAGFSHKFKAPIVASQTFMPGVWANYLVGNPAPSAFIPDPFIGYSSRMTFSERVVNFLFSWYQTIIHTLVYLPKHDAIMRQYFGDDLPPIEDILKNTSFVLVNHHHSLGFPRPYVPNMIEIAGMHIDPPQSLTKDMKSFMDNSPQGVILFSMGSNIRGADLPLEKRQALLKAFGRLKENVLWKFEEQLPDVPKNVKIMNWIPQSDVLAHSNLKLFITHGGLLSTTEAVERGVPVIGIPIFGDQPLNMRHTENAGLGKTLQFEEITEENVYNVINHVLKNPKYHEVAKTKSKLLKDNLLEPLEHAVWWIEYVLRHKGAHHLRSAAQDLAFYELYLWDVYAIAALIIIISFYVTSCIFNKFLKIVGLKK